MSAIKFPPRIDRHQLTIIPKLKALSPALIPLGTNITTPLPVRVRRKHVKGIANIHITTLRKARALRLHLVGSIPSAPPDADRLACFALAVGNLTGLDVLADFEAAADPAVDAGAGGPAEGRAFDFGCGDFAADVVVTVEGVGELFVLVVLVDL